MSDRSVIVGMPKITQLLVELQPKYNLICIYILANCFRRVIY